MTTEQSKTFTTKDVSALTNLSLRKVQYYSEKNVIKAKKQKVGRGFSYMFTTDDLIRFMIVAELSRFNIPFLDIYWTISSFFMKILKKDTVKKYLSSQSYLDDKYFYLWVESPHNCEFEGILDCMVECPDQPFPAEYFMHKSKDMKTIKNFEGFIFEPGSHSALIIDVGTMYAKRHHFIKNLMLSSTEKSRKLAGGKGSR